MLFYAQGDKIIVINQARNFCKFNEKTLCLSWGSKPRASCPEVEHTISRPRSRRIEGFEDFTFSLHKIQGIKIYYFILLPAIPITIIFLKYHRSESKKKNSQIYLIAFYLATCVHKLQITRHTLSTIINDLQYGMQQ